MAPGAGRALGASGMTLKVGADRSERWSCFEVSVAPGFDVGAHRHAEAEEIFYVLDGELDLLDLDPIEMTGDWRTWRSAAGEGVVRAGPGSLMYVPSGRAHAFANPGRTPVRMLFLVTPSGHEEYLEQVGAMVGRGAPDPAEMAALRARYDIEQLTPMRVAPPA